MRPPAPDGPLAWLTEPGPRVHSPSGRLSARVLASMLAVFLLVGTAGTLVQTWTTMTYAPPLAGLAACVVGLVIAQRLATTVWFRQAAWIAIASIDALCIWTGSADTTGDDPVWYAYLLMSVILAGVVLPPLQIALAWVLGITCIGLATALNPSPANLHRLIPILSLHGVVGALTLVSAIHWRSAIGTATRALEVVGRDAAMLRALEVAAAEMGRAIGEDAIFAAVGEKLRPFGIQTTVLMRHEGQLRIAYLSSAPNMVRRVEDLFGIAWQQFGFDESATSFHRRILAGETVLETDALSLSAQVIPLPAPLVRTGLALMGISRMIGTPVTIGDSCVGLIAVNAPELAHSDVAAIATFGKQVSANLERSRLLIRLQERVAEHERTLAELRASQEQLVRAQKLEAVSMLAGGLAHDFNNILTVVQTNLEVARGVLASSGAPQEALECLEDIDGVTSRAAVLTRQLLVFARSDLGKARTVSPAELLCELEPLLRNAIPESISLHLDSSGRDRAISIDPARLEQVLLNLVFNARDAMPTGGTLSLGTAVDGDSVVIEVSDDGTGMSADTRARVFEPFFTTKSDQRGSGLGLPMVQQIVEGADGTIAVTSEPDVGTTVSLRFPMVSMVHGPSRPDRRAAVPRAVGVILLCDDDSAIRQAVTRVLQRAGGTVHPCGTPSEALAVAASLDHLDVVISDVVLPEMSGPELVQRLRGAFPDVPALLMSGYAPSSSDVAAGSTPLLEKPFSPSDLLQALDRVRRDLADGQR